MPSDPSIHAKVLIFDSGVGGLSILQALRDHLPGCRYLYASDNAAFPYGQRDEAFLISRVRTVLRALINREAPDIVVVACNTASTVVLPHIRAEFTCPVVGVVPAIKPAAALSSSGVIGLLGTPGTVARPYTQNLIETFAADCRIVKVGSTRLVEMAEARLRGDLPDSKQLQFILAPLFEDKALDTVVLACTHFPLLVEELKDCAPRPLHWIDSGAAIARRVHSLLAVQTPQPVANPGEDKALFTARAHALDLLQGALQQHMVKSTEYLQLPL